MASAIYGGGRVRTNIPAEMAYNALNTAGKEITNSQLRLSTGKRINSAADDVAGYITSKSLLARNGALGSALRAAGDAKNVTMIAQDALEQINDLLTQMKETTAAAQGGAVGDAEKVALAKASFRLAQQIQFIADNTVFGGKQLLSGTFSGDWITGYTATDVALKIKLDLRADVSSGTDENEEFKGIGIAANFDLNATNDVKAVGSATPATSTKTFAGVAGLDLQELNDVSETTLGVFHEDTIETTLKSLTLAISNVNKVASYLGGVQVRLNSQEETLTSQITNYKAAISRIEDADIAQEQMNMIRNQFLQAASLTSLAQANQNPNQFLQLLR